MAIPGSADRERFFGKVRRRPSFWGITAPPHEADDHRRAEYHPRRIVDWLREPGQKKMEAAPTIALFNAADHAQP